MVILAGYHLLTRLQKYLSTVETYDATHLPILLMCAGVFGLIVNAFGIYLYFRCLYPLQRSQLSIQIFWHLAGCGLLCILNVCIIVLIMLYYLRIDTTFGVSSHHLLDKMTGFYVGAMPALSMHGEL